MKRVELLVVPDVPMIRPGDDLPKILQACLQNEGEDFADGDILVLAQKIVSKSEGQLVNLRDIVPGEQARHYAAILKRDPRHIQVVLNESVEVVWCSPGIFVVETKHGYVCANGGVDRSNIEQPGLEDGDEWLCLLPEDSNRSAAQIRQCIREIGGADIAVIINDTHGRSFRMGGMSVALGAAGIMTMVDARGESDMFGYKLQNTLIGTGDEIAAAASMVQGQAAEATPAVIIRGLSYRRPDPSQSDPGAAPLLRPKAQDVFRPKNG